MSVTVFTNSFFPKGLTESVLTGPQIAVLQGSITRIQCKRLLLHFTFRKAEVRTFYSALIHIHRNMYLSFNA